MASSTPNADEPPSPPPPPPQARTLSTLGESERSQVSSIRRQLRSEPPIFPDDWESIKDRKPRIPDEPPYVNCDKLSGPLGLLPHVFDQELELLQAEARRVAEHQAAATVELAAQMHLFEASLAHVRERHRSWMLCIEPYPSDAAQDGAPAARAPESDDTSI